MIMVASYCRVSTDKEDQANSFASQQRYFKEYINRQPDWELYRVYADEGLSGTTTKKRIEFNQMISDAKMGKFKIILTKEVSRFSRNILDTIGYTRELKTLGVGVLFLNDGINTLDSDAELRLSIMGSIAQEESRKTSTRVKWGQTRQMERGVVFGRSMLGYDVKGGKLTINPEGAELVRLIFYKYGVEKKGTSIIAREMREAGYLTFSGNPRWNNTHIVKILKNEKYVGDLVQKKTYTPDYLTHQKKSNNGAEEKVCLTNHHEAIIDRDLWNTVQAEMAMRNRHNKLGLGHGNRYVFSGKIKCAVCGASFVGRMRVLKDGSKVRRWSCGTATTEGRAGCTIGKLVRDDDAMHMLKTAVQSLSVDTSEIIHNVTTLVLESIRATQAIVDDKPDQLQFELERIQQKIEAVLDSYFSGDISKDDMLAMKTRYESQSRSLKKRIEDAEKQKALGNVVDSLRETIQSEVAALLCFDKESEVLCKTLLQDLTVFPDRHMELRLNDLPQVFYFTE